MKAIRVHEFGEPEVMQLEELPDLQPGPGQVVVRVKAAGVNPVDTYIRAGTYTRPVLPYTPGLDAAGIVEEIGEGVTSTKIGNRVYVAGTISGAYAEQALCSEAQVHHLPEPISYAQGAALGVPYATAYRALFQRIRAIAGESVLIHGASGGVGIAAVQLARAAGLYVIGTAGSPQGRDLVLAQGAHHVLDHRVTGYLEQISALTIGRGVNVILEMLSNVNLGNDLKVLALGGRIVVIGCRGTVEIDPHDGMGRDAAILFMTLFNATARNLASIHAALGAGLENGVLRPVVSQELPLAEAPRAHHAVIEASTFGKIVLIP
jgi:NADPH2:quinone reductase